jgi:hypothetical protein
VSCVNGSKLVVTFIISTICVILNSHKGGVQFSSRLCRGLDRDDIDVANVSNGLNEFLLSWKALITMDIPSKIVIVSRKATAPLTLNT